MTEIYTDGSYLENNPQWHADDSPWKAGQISKIIERNSLDPRSICEIGCGAGEILNQLAARDRTQRRYYGYEISPQAFQLCQARSRPNLSFKLADLLAEESAHFDLVLAIDVFEHVEDYFGFLRKLKGKADFKIFHIPLDLSVQSVLRATKLMRLRCSVGHIHYFTKELALATLADCGYSIVDHFYTAGALELAHRGWKANLMKMPRRIAFALRPDLAVRLLGGYSLMVLAR